MRTIIPFVFAVFSLAVSVFALSSLGCGGAAPPAQAGDSMPAAEPEGYLEDPGDEDVALTGGDEMPTEPPGPSGPVTAQISVRMGTSEAESAEIRVLDASGEAVFEGGPGESFTAEAGSYTAVISITDEDVMIDTPSREEEIILEPSDDGEPVTVEVRVPVARIRLNVRRNGRSLRRPRITLIRESTEEEVATFTAGNDHVPISPGRYEARVQVGGGNFTVTGLTFMDGATQSIPVDITEN